MFIRRLSTAALPVALSSSSISTRCVSTKQPKKASKKVSKKEAPTSVVEPPEIDTTGKQWVDDTTEKFAHFEGYQRAMTAKLQEMVAVDLAGETAAVRICQAHQFFHPEDSVVQEILEEEKNHYDIMTEWAGKLSVPPSLLDPLFHFVSIAMGSFTALLGPKAMMCCHAAIEEVITDHYNDQLRELVALESSVDSSDTNLKENLSSLRNTVKQLRDDEQHHHELGMDHGGMDFVGASILYHVVKGACKVGIFLAKRF